LDPKDDNSFLNINTKEDLEEASKKIWILIKQQLTN
jgi:molybdopterin-guanine dinucleotide biosynthesis protein A